MKIAVVGTGYVGLVAGACLAESGNDVVCVDKDQAKIRTLRRGRMPFYEPGLEELVRRNKQEGRLTFTATLPRAVAFPAAWHGAIDHAGEPLGRTAYTFWQLDDFLSRFQYPIFRYIAEHTS